MQGIIVKNISNDYTVKSNNELYICKPRGLFRKDNITPLVGDIVEFDEDSKIINKIHGRKNSLIRPAIANVDNAIIVTSVKDPDFDSYLLDKTLTIISYNNINPIIYFTKLDLLNNLDSIYEYINYYKKIGYLVATNKDELLRLIQNKIVVLTGQTGAGKSTLLNKIDPSLNLQTNEISYALGRGKHTTRHTELYETNNTYIVDTPGFSKIDFYDMTSLDIRDNMKELFDNLEHCKYQDCLHIKEDGCYIKEMVNNNLIIPSRYENYKNFIEKR